MAANKFIYDGIIHENNHFDFGLFVGGVVFVVFVIAAVVAYVYFELCYGSSFTRMHVHIAILVNLFCAFCARITMKQEYFEAFAGIPMISARFMWNLFCIHCYENYIPN